MSDNSSSNKRIAKNTIALYFRMVVLMIVSFYTTRVTLQVLGVDDYGIYNLIAGVIALLSFVYSVLESSIQRFFNYELGKGNYLKLQQTFSASILTMAILCVMVIIIAEIAGYIGIPKLNIPVGRMNVAKTIFHISVIQFCVGLIKVPYNSIIIAHEKMDFYAYLSILEALLKLSAVYLLYILPGDKLFYYAATQAIVLSILLGVYVIYCRATFQETKLIKITDKSIVRGLVSFSGWSLFGSVASVSVNQGLGILLNIFGNVAVVAASGLCTQVNSALNLLVSNFQVAFRPQIVKLYASDKKEELYTLLYRTTKISYFLIVIIAIPLIFCINNVLTIWLGEYPEYTDTFCCLRFILTLVTTIQAPLWMYVQATGRIKKYQITISIINILNLPFAYLGLKVGLRYEIVYVIEILIYSLMYIYRIIYVKREYQFPIKDYFYKSVYPILIISTIAIVPSVFCYKILSGTWQVVIPMVVSIILIAISSLKIGLTKNERKLIYSMIKNKLNK